MDGARPSFCGTRESIAAWGFEACFHKFSGNGLGRRKIDRVFPCRCFHPAILKSDAAEGTSSCSR